MLTDLDHRLREFSAALERIGGNLVELEADPTCSLLDVANLRGVTATRWAAARRARADLFDWLGRLTRVVHEAAQLRSSRGSLRPDREGALRELLCGTSVVLSETITPLTDRALLDRSREIERCSPADLLARMITRFDSVRQTVAEAGAVYDVVVPQLRDLSARLEVLAAVGGQDLVDLDVNLLQQEYRVLAEDVLADPLAVDRARVDRLEATIASATRQAHEWRELSAHAADRVADARALIRELRALVEETEELHRAVVARVRTPTAPPPWTVDPDIEARLAVVESLAARRDWRSVQRELQCWQQQADAALLVARARASSIRSILAERGRLRGLLDAYKAKAAALGRLEDVHVTRSYTAARDALYVAPSDLEAARTLIAEYRRSIGQIAAGTPEAEVPR